MYVRAPEDESSPRNPRQPNPPQDPETPARREHCSQYCCEYRYCVGMQKEQTLYSKIDNTIPKQTAKPWTQNPQPGESTVFIHCCEYRYCVGMQKEQTLSSKFRRYYPQAARTTQEQDPQQGESIVVSTAVNIATALVCRRNRHYTVNQTTLPPSRPPQPGHPTQQGSPGPACPPVTGARYLSCARLISKIGGHPSYIWHIGI